MDYFAEYTSCPKRSKLYAKFADKLDALWESSNSKTLKIELPKYVERRLAAYDEWDVS